jgi:hypothetical protein
MGVTCALAKPAVNVAMAKAVALRKLRFCMVVLGLGW